MSMKKTRMSRRELQLALANSKGMTLVEVLIVLTIMASIMGVVGVFVTGALDRSNVKEAQIEIRSLESMVNQYMLSASPRRLPDTLDDLTKGPAPVTKSVKPDPWGTEYVYKKINNREFEIISAGPDGSEGTDDDVRGAE